jgi:UDP-N-acetylglucosamine acyltransferase
MIHPSAQIHPNALIAADVEIGPFVSIEDNVEIASGTRIYPNVTIMSGARIGKNCLIFPGAVIAGLPQDLKFAGEESLAIIGDNTTIRECVTVNRGTASKGKTIVGSNCLVMAYSHVAHDCEVGNNVIIGNASQLAGEVVIHDHAILSGGCLVHQFTVIGSHIILQGGSRLSKDIPPYVTAGREPVCYAGINTVGLRRRGFSNEKIDEIQQIYRILYQSGLNNKQALEKIEEELPETEERNLIVNFIRQSSRGIIRGYMD